MNIAIKILLLEDRVCVEFLYTYVKMNEDCSPISNLSWLDENHALFGIEMVQSDLRFDAVVVRRESVSFQKDFVSFFGGLVEGNKEQVCVDCQSVQYGNLRRLRP